MNLTEIQEKLCVLMTNFFSKQLFFFLTLDTGEKTTEAPSRSEKKLLIGLVIAYFTVLVLIAVTFHWISRREKMKAAKGTEFEMDASVLCGSAATRLGNISEPEVGITHQAFAEDSENPANETVPESQEVPVQFSEDTKF